MVRNKMILVTVAVLAAATHPALADLILLGPEVVGGSGFGALPRALTIQSHGPSQTTEQGCIAPGLIEGSTACAPVDGLIGGDEAPPLGFPKQAAPTLSSLGITDATQIGILFDAIQPQKTNNNVVTINDLTLKLYNGATLVFTASGTFPNLATNPGNGNTDYLFVLDATEAAAFNTALAGNFTDSIALDSQISFPNQSSGPDSYVLVNRNVSIVPEPVSISWVCGGLIGIVLLRRRLSS